MKKLLFFMAIAIAPQLVWAQSCDKKSCGPEGTKKEEAAVISSMRTDLQTVINKMSTSSVAFDQQVKDMEIEKGSSDDESLLFISQAATTIRFELLSKVESSRIVSSLKEFRPVAATTKQQMVVNLKNEIEALAMQVGKL